MSDDPIATPEQLGRAQRARWTKELIERLARLPNPVHRLAIAMGAAVRMAVDLGVARERWIQACAELYDHEVRYRRERERENHDEP